MTHSASFVDIHCHLVPGIDDGSKSWDQSLAMAQMAVADGIGTIVVTPHQLGNYTHNQGSLVIERTVELQTMLQELDVPLKVLPGADVRIEPCMLDKLQSGEVLTLGNHGKHVLLELPHELYFPLEDVLDGLHRVGMVGILSHPERNQGILKQPQVLQPLVERGCLMQVTCGSLMGTFGSNCQQMALWMLEQGLVHFLATDAHGPNSRRPLMRRAYERAAKVAGRETADQICCDHPRLVAEGRDVVVSSHHPKRRGLLSGLFRRHNAA